MKILLDCSQLVVGGALQVGLAVLENAAKTSGYQWHVVMSEAIRDQARTSVLEGFQSVDCIRMKTRIDRMRLFLRMPKIVRLQKPDVVFTIFGPSYWGCSAPHLQGFAHPQMIYPTQDSRRRQRYLPFSDRMISPFKASVFRRSDYLVVETETVRERLSRYLGFPKERVFVVRNSYSPLFEKSISQTPRKSTENIFSFLIPSSFYLHKNLDSLPDAANELRRITGQPFEFVFTISEVEKGWLGIKRRAAKLGVANLFRTAGNVPHESIASLYRGANAVVLPTLLECSTAVYPESFMSGIPLATSDLDFAHELCGDGALYFDPYSPPDIAGALFRLMSDGVLREALVAKGKMVLNEKYPSPEMKWQDQLACLETVARLGKATGKVKT
jgi:glycosyltransferase involved in cell wall biosynthesis